MVAGHPFKGSWVYSTGQLLHPDLKRFSLQSAVLFRPPFPGKNPYDHPEEHTLPTFADFFSTYFGQQTLNISNDRCAKLFDGMKKVIKKLKYIKLNPFIASRKNDVFAFL